MDTEFGVFLCYTARVRVLIELSRIDDTELVDGLCHTVVFSKGIQLDCPSFESRYATHWVER
ncbi:hypothetical protein SADUNF_Sadunf02G0122700 [Salix dunnii]|uniref:Uncharacterized protein n=1 Tax=Salix dunnii TaxID=1413687 RepID=A0A835TJW4_9ROSI|nr:hypothetical protein SADUNF_Sadunf02G0122700 [Salix dunnii]